MPIARPASQYVVATIVAPWPGDLAVSLDGTELERVINSLARERALADAGLGFFVIDDVDVNQTPAVWTLRVSPPPLQQCSLVPFQVNIRHVLSSAKSTPLVVSFSAMNYFRVIGTSGRVVSLERPDCTAVDETRLDRRTGNGSFSTLATWPRGTSGFFRDTGLTPQTPLVPPDARSRVAEFARVPPTRIELASSVLSMSTTALLTGSELVTASRPDSTTTRMLVGTTFDSRCTEV